MERAEAEAIYEQGREAVVAVLLELSAQNALLGRQVAELSERLAKQDERIADLEQRLNRNSRNSSLPPSQDPPSAPARPHQAASGRRRGAQRGHRGHGRHLAPIEAVNEIVDHWPERCACGHHFSEAERHPLDKPARHQVVELPSIAVLVTEHRLHRLRCPACGTIARAALPPDVPAGAFGPRLSAAIATLAVRNRVSRRDTVELTGELFGVRLSAGSVDAILRRTASALGEPYEQLLCQTRASPVLNVDETGWRTRGGKRTLWGALTGRTAVFRIAADRHQREAKALLGEDFSGIACSDRWWAYNYLDVQRRQVCWAHLARDFRAHAEGLDAQKQFGEAGLQIAKRLFGAWDNYRAAGDRGQLAARIEPLKEELRALLEAAVRKSPRNRRHRGLARNLLKYWPALWTFASLPGVEPTNNHAERGLRGAVIYRKLSLGSQSEEGERAIERLLSASVTCRLQKRSLFAYLSEVLTASIRGDPVPALA
jgi:transposase